jgi:uncharacterized protein YndB with AHSA1/START domain
MANEKLRVSVKLPVEPEQLYRSWLDARAHSAFTGGEATIEARVGGRHTAWDGYIEGRVLVLEPHRRIVQSWRTSDFPPGSMDSRLEVLIKPAAGGSELVLLHSEIPPGQGSDYASGWQDHYFEPMLAHFAARPKRVSSKPVVRTVKAKAKAPKTPTPKKKAQTKKTTVKKTTAVKKKPVARR